MIKSKFTILILFWKEIKNIYNIINTYEYRIQRLQIKNDIMLSNVCNF
ncbi:MAG: hypothetical protein K0S93_755 [Nitrososphaeraceae archaeon]|jgi:hypothetical protein|nr:hypothetical protein [Nitrososphaeraceae archaeon]